MSLALAGLQWQVVGSSRSRICKKDCAPAVDSSVLFPGAISEYMNDPGTSAVLGTRSFGNCTVKKALGEVEDMSCHLLPVNIPKGPDLPVGGEKQ